jgi:hypothetical protein
MLRVDTDMRLARFRLGELAGSARLGDDRVPFAARDEAGCAHVG